MPETRLIAVFADVLCMSLAQIFYKLSVSNLDFYIKDQRPVYSFEVFILKISQGKIVLCMSLAQIPYQLSANDLDF